MGKLGHRGGKRKTARRPGAASAARWRRTDARGPWKHPERLGSAPGMRTRRQGRHPGGNRHGTWLPRTENGTCARRHLSPRMGPETQEGTACGRPFHDQLSWGNPMLT